MSEAVLELREVTKVHGQGLGAVKVLDQVSLELAPGELVGVMGPSGSGKTTMLTIGGCLQRPTAGTVIVDRTEVQGLGQSDLARIRRERIGFVFQSFNLFEALTAVENVQFALELAGRKGGEIRHQAEALLDMVGLGGRMSVKPRLLSGGEQQRVCIARAIANNAHLVLADEPTASLDGQRAGEVMGLLRAIARDFGAGILVVTHDLRAHHICDRLLWLEGGHLRPIDAAEIGTVGGEPAAAT